MKGQVKGLYPVLMKDTRSDLVVLFSSEQSGIVMNPNDEYKFGKKLDIWNSCEDPREWTKFQGVIELSND